MKHIPHYFTLFLKNVAYLTMSLVVAITILVGIPIQTQPYVSLGHYRLTQTANGYSIYQPGGSYRYYTIHVPNTVPVKTNKMLLFDSLQARLLHTLSPVTLLANNDIVSLSATVTDTIAAIHTTGKEIDITYTRDDLVFDGVGTLYTEHDESTMKTAQYMLKNFLKQGDPSMRDMPVPGNVIYIINPKIPGILSIATQSPTAITIHKDTKTISTAHTDKAIQIKSLVQIDDISKNL